MVKNYFSIRLVKKHCIRVCFVVVILFYGYYQEFLNLEGAYAYDKLLRRIGNKYLPRNLSLTIEERKMRIASHSVQLSTTCGYQATNWSESVEPKFKLDPQKLLIPALTNGPTNQLLGFHQSVLLSIILNRTLVLPLFYQHSIASRDDVIRNIAIDRFNVSKLRELVSIISINEAKETCKNRFDAFFQAANAKENSLIKHLTTSHLETGIRGINYKPNVDLADIEKFLKTGAKNSSAIISEDKRFMLTGPFYPGVRLKNANNLEGIRSLYHSDEKCAFYCCPFRQLGVSVNVEKPELWPESKKEIMINPWKKILTNKDAGILMKEIAMHTPPVNYIRDIAKGFQQNYLKTSTDSKYLAVHWRYDKEDYLHYLCGDHYLSRRNQSCATVRKAFNASLFAHGVANKISLLRKKMKIESVYLAAPSTVMQFVENTEKIFKNIIKGIKLFYSRKLKAFVQAKVRNCQQFQDEGNLLDLLSQIEMELCSGSDVFVWSQQSTWSKHALTMRDLFYSKSSADNEPVLKMIMRD